VFEVRISPSGNGSNVKKFISGTYYWKSSGGERFRELLKGGVNRVFGAFQVW
jgi:hypothetical protein